MSEERSLRDFIKLHPLPETAEAVANLAQLAGYKCQPKTVTHYRYLLKAASKPTRAKTAAKSKAGLPAKEQVAVLTPKGAAVVLLLRNGYVEEAKALAKL